MTPLMKFRREKKVATGLLHDKLHKQDLGGPLSNQTSKVLGPISRYRVADILTHMKCFACFPSFVGFSTTLKDVALCVRGSR